MKSFLHFVAIIAALAIGVYLLVTVFVIFALLAVLGIFVWLYLRYFSKSKAVVTSREGVTIDYIISEESADTSKQKPTTKD